MADGLRLLAAAFLIALAAGALVACGDSDDELQIAAASDLRAVLEENREAIEDAAGMRVTFVFGSSGQLHEQVLAGAKYGLFLSADTRYVDALAEAGKVAPDGRGAYAVGSLALVWRDGLPPLADAHDLERADIQRITIANPGHAPYGRAAQETLTSLGLWGDLQPRIVLAEQVRQATEYVRTGNADAGLVALALIYGDDRPFVVVDGSLHQPIVQSGAVVAGSGHEDEARGVLNFLLSAEGQRLLANYGFEPAP